MAVSRACTRVEQGALRLLVGQCWPPLGGRSENNKGHQTTVAAIVMLVGFARVHRAAAVCNAGVH